MDHAKAGHAGELGMKTSKPIPYRTQITQEWADDLYIYAAREWLKQHGDNDFVAAKLIRNLLFIIERENFSDGDTE